MLQVSCSLHLQAPAGGSSYLQVSSLADTVVEKHPYPILIIVIKYVAANFFLKAWLHQRHHKEMEMIVLLVVNKAQ